jgi:catechol 2,3-dioxygenase-like lactoylglutathione lyase family enzyme
MRLSQITPFIPCTSLSAQIEFFVSVLGFEVGSSEERFAFLSRDDVAVRLVQVDDTVDLTQPERQISFYIDVDDIDALYATMKSKLDNLSSGRVRPPFNQDYDQREFHVADEDCTLIFFGQPLRHV